jgi:hypothetical protein
VAQDLTFLTIITYGRTGSTALQSALNALPGVLVRGENYNALRGLAVYSRAIAASADRHHAGRPGHPWFGTAKLNPRETVADLREHVIEHILRPRAGTKWIGFKEVRYEPGHFEDYEQLLDYLLFLNTIFPGIRFIFNVRDEVQTAKSGWWPDNPEAIDVLRTTRQWLEKAHEDISRVLAGGNRSRLLRHEEWSSDPNLVLEAFAGLGLPQDDNAVRSALAAQLVHGKVFGSQS